MNDCSPFPRRSCPKVRWARPCAMRWVNGKRCRLTCAMDAWKSIITWPKT